MTKAEAQFVAASLDQYKQDPWLSYKVEGQGENWRVIRIRFCMVELVAA